ncbi:hypothetical protein RE6C_05942 [Rhodopirellula europaea 6C]|uniref:Uncharacterized protein n=2 Tax=Rhodopirellula TaxID=265488 RepID=M2AUW7_9BACT|nr:hypothetical protein RE6C_05942 [Rhodopirellula europaea 6C]
MTQMDDLSSFERSVSAALLQAGCDTFTASDLQRHTREVRDDIYADELAHGGDIASPFVNFIITHDVAIFTIFDDPFLVYVIPCTEREMISDTDAFAMFEVPEHIELLANKYGRSAPDATISRSLAETWLG